jgi:phosphate acyltransferase
MGNKVVLDAMGGDHAPQAAVEGAWLYARDENGQVVLVGDETAIRAELSRVGAQNDARLSIVHASEVIDMAESPGQAIRRKRNSSIRVCFDLLKEGKADAMISAGNSGAVLAGAVFVLGRLDGVDRPAIGTLLPTVAGHMLLIDAGAITDCKPVNLAQFAAMGEVYARRVMGFVSPRVGLLSNGEEESKGTDLTREAHGALRRADLSFVGYVEGKDIFSGEVEVVVTDGFTGNVVLKTAEGAASCFGEIIRREVKKHLRTQVGALLMKPTFDALRKAVDYSEYGGAPLVGVDGLAMIAHGRSTPKAIKNALKAAGELARVDTERDSGLTLRAELSAAAKRAEEWLKVPAPAKGPAASAR